MNNMIRLVDPEAVGYYPDKIKVSDNITVIRTNYSDELMAFTLKSKAGILMFVNNTYSVQEQARAISTMKNKIKLCGINEVGVLKKGFIFHRSCAACENCKL